MNNRLQTLPASIFGQLRNLMAECSSPQDRPVIDLSIGAPKHPTPEFILDALKQNVGLIDRYSSSLGYPELRNAIAEWLTRRFSLPEGTIQPERHVLNVSGTKEAIFAFAQCCVNSCRDSGGTDPVVIIPNPFYQTYEGAALFAGAEPVFLNSLKANHFLPDLDEIPPHLWERCQLIYICSPGNPTGAVFTDELFAQLFEYAEKYDFIIASDECYSEIYFDEDQPPQGLLEYAAKHGNTEFKRCMVFHSLSKRSNAPGLRSGFVAGDPALIQQFLRYRVHQGCNMPNPVQIASIAAWQDETHVLENRRLYREKFQAVLDILQPILDISLPDAGFYLWPKVPMSDVDFTRELYSRQNVIVIPGSYLSREAHGVNPGENHVRMALVPEYETCVEAANRMKKTLNALETSA